jgi:hypothetical protein
MRLIWQEFNGRGRFCHWWQETNEPRIPAMNALLILVLAVSATTGFAWLALYLYEIVTGDGYGARPGPRSHHDDTGRYDRAA